MQKFIDLSQSRLGLSTQFSNGLPAFDSVFLLQMLFDAERRIRLLIEFDGVPVEVPEKWKRNGVSRIFAIFTLYSARQTIHSPDPFSSPKVNIFLGANDRLIVSQTGDSFLEFSFDQIDVAFHHSTSPLSHGELTDIPIRL